MKHMTKILAGCFFILCAVSCHNALAAEESQPAGPLKEEYLSRKSLEVNVPSFVSQLRLSGRVQGLWKMWGQEDDTAYGLGDIFEKQGFRILRWRIGLETRLFDHVRLEVGMGESEFIRTHDINLLDAMITLDYLDYATVSIGAGKVPGGRQILTSSRDMQFIFRPVLCQQHIVPATEKDVTKYNGIGLSDRDVGITLFGKIAEGIVKYHAGVYNGKGEYFRGNIDGKYAYVVRAVVNPLGDFPDIEGDFSRDLKVSIGCTGFANRVLDARYLGWGIDAEAKGYGFSIRAEFMRSEQKPKFRGQSEQPIIKEKTYRDGFYVQAGYFVWPRYLECAYRYDQFDDNEHLTDNGDIKYHTIGINWYIQKNHYYKVQLNYIIREEDGPKLDNNGLYALVQVAY